jgi:putative sigma-54 modulation protein
MQVEIKSRHFNLGEKQKEKIINDLEKLERYSPRPPVSARMTIVNEKSRFTADLSFFLKNSDFRTKVEGSDPELAADEAIDNIRTQLQRFKGKMVSRKKGEEGGLGRAMVREVADLLEPPGTDVPSEGFILKDMSVNNAMDVFQSSSRPFLVFRNSDTAKICVVYKRDNGQLGLLESQEE